ncbi:MAG: ATP-binding protein, partial [Lachnospiraceae bacterium]|nr:ATP-binding protein [Lachnospiraceae bacterium]
KILLMESNTLFDDMVKKLDDSPILKQALMRILFKGERIPYNIDNHAISQGLMFGFLKSEDGMVQVSNRIFETRMYNLFISEELLDNILYHAASSDKERNYFVHDGMLDMERVLERFVESFTDIYYDADKSFVEENGRRFFLIYLKPIINGVGNFYVEARTRNMRRTDIVIDYRGQQFVCELKIWHGKEYNTRGEDQLMDYLDSYHLTTGYMLSFNFNKNKQIGVRRIQLGEKLLIEAVV